MKVTIHLSTRTRDSGFYRENSTIFSIQNARELFDTNGYKVVGQVDVADDMVNDSVAEALDCAYARTQNLNDYWNAEPCRSTTVGDIFEIDGQYFIVSGLGFDRL